MNISASTKIGVVATEYPLATRVFARHGIDFCCGGGKPISAACESAGVDTSTILDELGQELQEAPANAVRWDEVPLGDLIDHILVTYHEPLKEELPRLEMMCRKVHKVHGHRDPERLAGILRTLLEIKADIEQHLPKEEQILFPMIRRGQGHMAEGPISVMEMEHDALGGMLVNMRRLTDDFTFPDDACNTWRALWVGLETLERDLHEHIHLENNILHKRALGS